MAQSNDPYGLAALDQLVRRDAMRAGGNEDDQALYYAKAINYLRDAEMAKINQSRGMGMGSDPMLRARPAAGAMRQQPARTTWGNGRMRTMTAPRRPLRTDIQGGGGLTRWM